MLGPPLTVQNAPRVEHQLTWRTRARLLELLHRLRERKFICHEEVELAEGASEVTLLAEALVRALKRYDAYLAAARDHTVLNPQLHVDWTSDRAVENYKSDKNKRRW